MGGGGGSSQTQSFGTTQSHGVSDQHGEFHFPQWYEDAAKANYEAGKKIDARPYEAYAGTVVPEPSRTTPPTRSSGCATTPASTSPCTTRAATRSGR
jgi:hypothetical protein